MKDIKYVNVYDLPKKIRKYYQKQVAEMFNKMKNKEDNPDWCQGCNPENCHGCGGTSRKNEM